MTAHSLSLFFAVILTSAFLIQNSPHSCASAIGGGKVQKCYFSTNSGGRCNWYVKYSEKIGRFKNRNKKENKCTKLKIGEIIQILKKIGAKYLTGL